MTSLVLATVLLSSPFVSAQDAATPKSLWADPWAYFQREKAALWNSWKHTVDSIDRQTKWLSTAISYYNTAQMTYKMYNRVASGNINLLVSTSLPSFTMDSAIRTEDGRPATESITITPVPTSARRNEGIKKFNLRGTVKLDIENFFKGNPLEWFDMDAVTTTVNAKGEKIERRPEWLVAMAKWDAMIAVMMNLQRVNLLPEQLSIVATTVGDSELETAQLDLQSAYAGLRYAAESDGMNSQSYKDAYNRYTTLVQRFNEMSDSPITAKARFEERKQQIDEEIKAKSAQYAEEAFAISMKRSNAISAKENEREINKAYPGKKSGESLPAGALIGSVTPMSPEEAKEKAQKESMTAPMKTSLWVQETGDTLRMMHEAAAKRQAQIDLDELKKISDKHGQEVERLNARMQQYANQKRIDTQSLKEMQALFNAQGIPFPIGQTVDWEIIASKVADQNIVNGMPEGWTVTDLFGGSMPQPAKLVKLPFAGATNAQASVDEAERLILSARDEALAKAPGQTFTFVTKHLQGAPKVFIAAFKRSWTQVSKNLKRTMGLVFQQVGEEIEA